MHSRFDQAIAILEAISQGAGTVGADVTIDLRSREEILLSTFSALSTPASSPDGITIVHRPDPVPADDSAVGALHVLAEFADENARRASPTL